MYCKIILPTNEIHKLPTVPKSYEDLHQIALRKFKGKVPDNFYFKYKDTDDELITLTNDEDFQTAVVTSEADNVKILRIFLIPESSSPSAKENPFAPNLPNPSYEKPENSFEQVSLGKLAIGHAYSQGNPKLSSESYDNKSESELNRLAEQLPHTKLHLQKSRSNPAPVDPQDVQVASKREISFDGRVVMERAGKEGNSSPFSQEQLYAISELLERKIEDKIEKRVEIAVKDIMGSVTEEIMNRSMKRNPYTHTPFMSKSVVPSYGVRAPVKKVKEYQDFGEYFCVICKEKIEAVRYSCLDCINYDLCRSCEEKAEHQHPLLKSRLTKEHRPSDNSINDASESSQVSISRDTERRSTNIIYANKSHSNGANMTDESTYDNSGRNLGNNVSPAKGGFSSGLRYSNSMAYINLNDKNINESVSNSSYHSKNPSNFSSNTHNKSPHSANIPLGINHNKGFSTPRPTETPYEKEAKRYKAIIVKPPLYDLINVKPGGVYKVEFTIKNAGTERWPDDIKLVCINGVHKGVEEGLPALNQGQKYEVRLALKAPQEINRFLSQWRLQYREEGGTPKPFGSNLFVEINVIGKDKGSPTIVESVNEQDPEKESSDKGQEEEPKKIEIPKEIEQKEKEKAKAPSVSDIESKEWAKPEEARKEIKPEEVRKESKPVESPNRPGLTQEERQIIQETKCSELVLRQAQALHTIYSSIDIRKQIDFVEECPIHLDINEIVMLYSSRMESSGSNY